MISGIGIWDMALGINQAPNSCLSLLAHKLTVPTSDNRAVRKHIRVAFSLEQVSHVSVYQTASGYGLLRKKTTCSEKALQACHPSNAVAQS